MSVQLLLTLVSVAPDERLAIVSADLLRDLFAAGEIAINITTAHVPSDPDSRKSVDNLLRSVGINPAGPIIVPYYTLKKFPHVHVQQDAQHGIVLASNGPRSYQVH
ncbi:MAG: hypothetical protein JWR80_4153 [Bradyrhizobium sp.]|nr:hypothetical protein [Bradyrhizobium sp.]